MDDFEYSVHISDRDWDSFFQECEECNLLPPSLAGPDDSGMSDIDDVMSRVPRRVFVDPEFIDGPPDFEGSPVDLYLSEHGLCSPEQVLSGSEDDVHLETVNMFFERLRSVSGAAAGKKASATEVGAHLQTENPCGADHNHTDSDSVDLVVREEDAMTSHNTATNDTKWMPTQIKSPDLGNRTDLAGRPVETATEPWSEMANQQSPSASHRRKKKRRKRMSTEPVDSGHCYEGQLSESDTERFNHRTEMDRNASGGAAKMADASVTSKTDSSFDHLPVHTNSLPGTDRVRQSTGLLAEEEGLDYPKSEPENCHCPTDVNVDQDKCLTLSHNKFMDAVAQSELKAATGSDATTPFPSNRDNVTHHLQPISSIPLEADLRPSDPLTAHLCSNTKGSDPDPGEGLQDQEIRTATCAGMGSSGGNTEDSHPDTVTTTVKSARAEDSDKKDEMVPALNVTCEGVYSIDLKVELDMAWISDNVDIITSVPQTQENPPHMQIHKQPMTSSDILPLSKTEVQPTESPSSTNEQPSEGRDYTAIDSPVEITEDKSQSAVNDNGTVSAEKVPKAEQIHRRVHMSDVSLETEISDEEPSKTPESLIESEADSTCDFSEGQKHLDATNLEEMKESKENRMPNSPESMREDDPEHENSEALTETKPTIHAISSFWSEMEKLTINDILRLRLVSNNPHPSVLMQPEEVLAETSDTADSGYFTHLDDSKPDRSSGDMSAISDFDEELLQIQNHESSKQEEKCAEATSLGDVIWESDSDPVLVGDEMEDVVIVASETGKLMPHFADTTAHECFRKMYKNISVQNLQVLEAQPLRKILRNASINSLQSLEEKDRRRSRDPFYHLDPPSPDSSSDDEQSEGYSFSFSEIVEFLFSGDEPQSDPESTENTTSPYISGTSIPETYDHFFSEFENRNFFFPLTEDSMGVSSMETVPIFSCSRSINQNLQFPEAYDYFFPDSPGQSDEEEEECDSPPLHVVTRYNLKRSEPICTPTAEDAASHPDMYEHFYNDVDSGDLFWTNLLSLRRALRSSYVDASAQEDTQALVPVSRRKNIFRRTIQPVSVLGFQDKPFPDPLLDDLEIRVFKKMSERQIVQREMQSAVADPRLDVPLLPLRQSDMCLVCIAFASWVLKSANSEAADAWKAVLLANISALSAIRYLRRKAKQEVHGTKLFPQILPAQP